LSALPPVVVSGLPNHADLLAQLVDEDHDRVGLVGDAGDLAHRLAHQAGLQAEVLVAHVALELGAGDQGGDRVDHDQADAAGAGEGVDDLEGLLAAVGLRDQEVLELDAEAGAYLTSRACSASMKAHTRPARCASAIACSMSVVLPDDSGP
jgi:hypothetical protein